MDVVDRKLLEVVQIRFSGPFAEKRENDGTDWLDVFADKLGNSNGHACGFRREIEVFFDSSVFGVRSVESKRNLGSENDLFHVAMKRK